MEGDGCGLCEGFSLMGGPLSVSGFTLRCPLGCNGLLPRDEGLISTYGPW